ncbi:hypothetical protein [Urechidicola vernalis]|uniref:Lipocalin-like domain-containing protein n=1 Tax=Urechidicola vernalis TaxID=3075600 RepID=A0ABU2Y315_9FLAO|nr:hypothetical protein [Urechidicola sp. P050]MDT0552545.1 hypothetical protein [Urechidicola sp. P050]
MKKLYLLMVIAMTIISCAHNENSTASIKGTWKLFYGSIEENDSLQIKDISKSDFIKIINASHFSFFNQVKGTSESFYGGAGTYTLNGNDYVESLNYIGSTDLRGHKFPFKIELKGDTLIQYGHEKVEAANIDRYIVEKYVRIK